MNVPYQGKFLRRGVVSTSPNPKAGRPPLAGCPRVLMQYIRSYPPYWMLHPQAEDAPCSGDRHPLVCVCVCVYTHTFVHTHTHKPAPVLSLFVLPLLFSKVLCQFTPSRNLLFLIFGTSFGWLSGRTPTAYFGWNSIVAYHF